jgi:lipoprotein
MVIALAFRIRSQRAKRLWEHVIAMLNERHERFVMLLPARAGSPC